MENKQSINQYNKKKRILNNRKNQWCEYSSVDTRLKQPKSGT